MTTILLALVIWLLIDVLMYFMSDIRKENGMEIFVESLNIIGKLLFIITMLPTYVILLVFLILMKRGKR